MGRKPEFHGPAILGCEGDALRLAGFDATETGSLEFTVDLRTRRLSGEVHR
jgi:hypothetical protein